MAGPCRTNILGQAEVSFALEAVCDLSKGDGT